LLLLYGDFCLEMIKTGHIKTQIKAKKKTGKAIIAVSL